MDNWTVVLIIALVFGVIISNLMLLKHSAKFTFPSEFNPKAQAKRKEQQQQPSED